MNIVEYETNIDYLIHNGIVEVRDEGHQESVFIVERTEESSKESIKKNISETNIEMETQMTQKEDGNTEIRLGNVGILYERLILSLKSETNFLEKISSLQRTLFSKTKSHFFADN